MPHIIEKDVPVPSEENRKSRSRTKYPWPFMGHMQSVFFPTEGDRPGAASKPAKAAQAYFRNRDLDVVCRKAYKDGVLGVRVWVVDPNAEEAR